MRLTQAMREYALGIRHREQMLATRLQTLDLRRVISHQRDILAHGCQQLISGIKSQLHAGRARFEIAVGKIDALSPLGILQRGFALCRDAEGALIKNAAEVNRGDRVTVTLAVGQLDCEVKSITNGEG